MNNDHVHESNYKGITFRYTEEASIDLKEYYNINIEDEIIRGIDLELQQVTSNVVIHDNVASLHVTKT